MTPIHPNYAKAAKLMIVSFGISCISLIQVLWSLFSMDVALTNTGLASHSDGFKSIAMITIIITIMYFFIMAHLIRQGYPWMKYLLLGFLAWMIFSLVTSGFGDISKSIVDGIIIIIRVWMIVLLFQIPKTINDVPLTSVEKA